MQLTTERLCLRDVTEMDYDFIYELERSKFTLEYEDDLVPSMNDVYLYFSKMIELRDMEQKKKKKYYFIVTKLEDTSKPIGKLILWENDAKIREWEMGWFMHQDYIGNGYAPEAAKAVLKFAFDELSAHRVQAVCNDLNQNSERVMQKIGMQKEGTCRGVRFMNNRWYGSHIYAILDSDFLV